MSRPARRLDRRTLLTDLGRATLATVVLGAAACATPTSVGGPAGDTASDAGTGDGGGDASGRLTWERASFGFVSAYVLVRSGEAVVFDTGTGDDGVAAIGDALTAAGVGWDAVSNVLLSHRHGDHVGGVELVAEEAPDAMFLAGMPDLEAIRDRVPQSGAVAQGDTVLGLTVIETPGHTAGHVSALDEEAGLLIAGDALVNGVTIGGTTGDGIEGSPPEFTADAEAAAASVMKLAGLSFDELLFGHGDPITSNASAMLTEYADSL